jgi:hypothetical protein
VVFNFAAKKICKVVSVTEGNIFICHISVGKVKTITEKKKRHTRKKLKKIKKKRLIK